MTHIVLGLDGGGTQTRVAAATIEGEILGRGQAGACNLAAVPLHEALAAATAAADLALQDTGRVRSQVSAVCAGVAGVSFTERRDQFQAGLQEAFPGAHIAVVPDYAIALTGATGGAPGVIVIAGTGSAAYGENAEGKCHKTGAYGYLIDDGGSGYGVGRAALAAVLCAADGTGQPTSLTGRILATLDLAAPADLIPAVYGGQLDRVSIAALSRAVAEAVREEGDAAAKAILMRAGGTLAHLAYGVTQRLFPDLEGSFPITRIGSLWNAGDCLTDVFARSLHRFAPRAVLTPPLRPPVEGAVMRAAALGAAP